MLYDLIVFIKPEEIHGYILIAAWPYLVSVQCYQISLGNRPYKFDAFTRKFFRHFLEIGNKRFLAITYNRVVLNILVTNI